MEWPARRRRVEELVDELYLSIYRYAYRLTGNTADAEDLTQEAFCKAQMRLHQLRDPAARKAWLFQIVRNEYLHSIRDQNPKVMVGLDSVDASTASDASIDLPVDVDELQKALALLPEGYRTPVILYYFEEFSYRQIAEQMDLPIGTVMSRLSRAKAHLRQHLAPKEEQVKVRANEV
ncbi:MAG: RNA polymerase sigma factor [Gemmataceae bacterium]